MRKVNRGPKPSSLSKNGVKWTKDLLDQIELVGDYSKVDSSYKSKYNTASVKEELNKMYGDFCCYCESRITVSGYRRIEHLKPRVKFPEECYSWDNLHYACEVCNGHKGDDWDYAYPILDPCIDIPMNHLEFRNHLLFARDSDPRGKVTIQHVGLNRDNLAEARLRILSQILEIALLAKKQKGTMWQYETLKLLRPILNEKEYFSFKEYIENVYLK